MSDNCAKMALPPTPRQRLRLWIREHRPRLHMMPGYVTLYPIVQRAMHRVGLHKTRRHGPMIEDGAIIERCDWCGISRVVTNRKMREAAEYFEKTGKIAP